MEEKIIKETIPWDTLYVVKFEYETSGPSSVTIGAFDSTASKVESTEVNLSVGIEAFADWYDTQKDKPDFGLYPLEEGVHVTNVTIDLEQRIPEHEGEYDGLICGDMSCFHGGVLNKVQTWALPLPGQEQQIGLAAFVQKYFLTRREMHGNSDNARELLKEKYGTR